MLDLDRNLWFLFALNLAIGFAAQIIQPLFPLYLRSLNATEVEIGFVISMAGFAAMILMLPSGILMDRVGKKRMLLISVVLGAIPPILIASTKDWRMVAPFFMVFNMSFPFFAPARMAMIAETATPENRATLFGLMNIAWPIGGIIGPALSGYIVDHLGWGYPFLISAAIMAVSLLPTIMLKEKKDISSITKDAKDEMFEKERERIMALEKEFNQLSVKESDDKKLPFDIKSSKKFDEINKEIIKGLKKGEPLDKIQDSLLEKTFSIYDIEYSFISFRFKGSC